MRQGETEHPIAPAPAARGEAWDDRPAGAAPPPATRGEVCGDRPARPAPATGGILWRAWMQVERAVTAARGPLARSLDGITLAFLGALVRTRLVSAAPAGAEYDSVPPAAARAADGARLETELRLVLTTGAALYVPLFVGITIASHQTGCRECWFNYLSTAYYFIPLLGVLCAVTRLRYAHPLHDRRLRQTAYAFIGGLFLWFLGGLTWMVYNALGTAAPYPSLADIWFFAHLLLWQVAIFFLYKFARTTYSDELGAMTPMAGSCMAVIVTLTLFAQHDIMISGGSASVTNDLTKLGFDIGYPIIRVFNVFLMWAVLAGKKFDELSREMKIAIVCLTVGMFVDLVSSVAFDFATTIAERDPASPLAYFNGHPVDFVYAVALYVLSLAMTFLDDGGADGDRAAAGPSLTAGG
jgi:hypothetical protein